MELKINTEGIFVDYLKTLLAQSKKYKDSHCSYYDYKTHEQLIDKLREMRDTQGINLMPMCNLYTGRLIDNYRISASGNSVLEKNNFNDTELDLIIIPVKPNQAYTMFFNTENIYPISVAGVEFDGVSFISGTLYNVQTIIDTGLKKPFKYVAPNTNPMKPENNYIIIQLPKRCSKRIVVEGDFTDQAQEFVNSSEYTENGITISTSVKDFIHFTVDTDAFESVNRDPVVLTSLGVNLLIYAMTPNDSEDNILLLQELMQSESLRIRVGSKYTKELNPGKYTDEMKKWLYEFSKNYTQCKVPTGLVDKDTEQMLFKGVLNE